MRPATAIPKSDELPSLSEFSNALLDFFEDTEVGLYDLYELRRGLHFDNDTFHAAAREYLYPQNSPCFLTLKDNGVLVRRYKIKDQRSASGYRISNYFQVLDAPC